MEEERGFFADIKRKILSACLEHGRRAEEACAEVIDAVTKVEFKFWRR